MISRIFLSFSVKVRCIIVAGGGTFNCGRNVEIIFGDFKTRQLPDLKERSAASSMALHDGEILLIGGGFNRECYKLLSRQNMHSFLTDNRIKSGTVTTEAATFLFGGMNMDHTIGTTYEYLPKGSTQWQKGKIPIPKGFLEGCAIAIKSGQEILLIGGHGTERRILSFNDHSFKELSTKLMNDGRIGHDCAFIPGTKKVMITGGCDESLNVLNSTEILDTEDGSITRGSPMIHKRFGHGIGVITINNQDQLVVFGGTDNVGFGFGRFVYSIEVYNNSKKRWEFMDRNSVSDFSRDFSSYLSVRLGDILQKA